MTNKQLGIFIGVIILIAVGVGAFFVLRDSGSSEGVGATPTGTNAIEEYVAAIKYNGGIYSLLPIQTTSDITAAAGTFTGTFTGAAATLSGLLTTNAGHLRSSAIATSTTATSQTLVQADILNYDTILLTPNTGDLTLTWPATSTLTSLVPTAGDTAEQCMHNASTTAGIDITVAAGAGIDLETASSSITGGGPILTILADNSACFKYVRKTNTDILMLMTRFVNGD